MHMTPSRTHVGIAAVAASLAFASLPASAAQFQPTTGGNLDDAANWNNITDGSFAVLKAQGGPLTISQPSATLPKATANLQYRNAFVYTNDFGAGYVLSLTGAFSAFDGSTLFHRSGTLSSSASNSSIKDATVVVEGSDSELSLATLTMDANKGGSLIVRNGARLTITSALNVNAGATVSIENATLAQDTTLDNSISVYPDASFSMRNSTLSYANPKGKLLMRAGTAIFDGTTIAPGSTALMFGGENGTAMFTGGTSTITRRFNMYGDGFTFCVSNTTVNFTPADASELFITSGGTINDGFAKTFRFCGAAPRLVIASSGGFHLRAQKGVTLQFDIPANGFPADAAVVEITGGGTFKGDSGCLAASQVVVNVDDDCPPGTYTLLQGKNATTFLTGETPWVANCGTRRKAKFQSTDIDGLAALQVVVADAHKGTILLCY